MLSLFYRRIHFHGPIKQSDVATIVVANHANAFIDPFALQVALGQPLKMTVRADWLNHWLVKWQAKWVGAIPLVRGHQDPKCQNLASFRELNNTLKQGDRVIIFPEGVSHNRPRLRTFKKGAAQLAKQFVQSTGQPVRVIQLGVYYEDKSRLHSDIWVEVAGEKTYQNEKDFQDLAATMDEWKSNIQQVLPERLARKEKNHLNWINRQANAVHGNKFGFISRTENLHHNSRFNCLHNWLATSDIDLSVLKRHAQRRTLLLRFFAELIVLLSGLPFAIIGLVSHLPLFVIHYFLTKRNSIAEDKWASTAFVVGLPLYPIAWLVLAFAMPTADACFLALCGVYSLFYWRNSASRLKSIKTAMKGVYHPATQRALVSLAENTF